MAIPVNNQNYEEVNFTLGSALVDNEGVKRNSRYYIAKKWNRNLLSKVVVRKRIDILLCWM